MRLWNLSCVSSWREGVRSRWQALEVLPVVLVGLLYPVSTFFSSSSHSETYKWQTAVCAPADLWLVQVDEDSWVSQWSTTAITGHDTLLGPCDWLLVNQVNGCVWAWLRSIVLAIGCHFRSYCLLSLPRTAMPRYPYLILHNSLLKAWANHGLCAWLLAPAPCGSTVWRLRDSLLLSSKWIFYQSLILLTSSVRGQCIGAGQW